MVSPDADRQTMKDAGTSSVRTEMEGMLCVLVSGILFGTMPLMTRAAYSLGSNALTTAFGRFLTGAVFSGLLLLPQYKTVFSLRRGQILSLAALSVFFSAMPCLLYASYQYIHSGLATTLHFTYPAAVMVLSCFVSGARARRRDLACILMCLSGILLLGRTSGHLDIRGMLPAAGSGLVYAVYIVGVERSGLKELPVLINIFWMSLFSAADLLLVGLLTGRIP